MINQDTNIVENICLWDGNTETWTPPYGYYMIQLDITVANIWIFSDSLNDYELTPIMGAGEIGFTWDGTELTTNQLKPSIEPISIEQPPTVQGIESV